jgi:HEAT repeat protein
LVFLFILSRREIEIMRPKFIIALVLAAFLVLGVGLILKQRLGNTSAPTAATPPTAAAPADANPETNAAPPAISAPIAAAPVATNTNLPAVTLTPKEREAAIEAEIDRLSLLSRKKDPASLPSILASLKHPEKEVREAAIEATRQFGSKDAIPALKEAANNTDDFDEKIDLLDAADFLSLPSINTPGLLRKPTPEQLEAAKQRRLERQNREQARHPPSGQNSTTGQNQ